jgi:hypothetical protein
LAAPSTVLSVHAALLATLARFLAAALLAALAGLLLLLLAWFLTATLLFAAALLTTLLAALLLLTGILVLVRHILRFRVLPTAIGLTPRRHEGCAESRHLDIQSGKVFGAGSRLSFMRRTAQTCL